MAQKIGLARPEHVSKQVSAVRFGFYDPEESRALSVARVQNPNVLDALNNPTPDGLCVSTGSCPANSKDRAY